jgi:hypothetical protein
MTIAKEPITAGYGLDPLEIERVCVEFLAKHPDPTGQFVSVVVGPERPLAGVARAVETRMAGATTSADIDAVAAAHSRYDKKSLFFVVLDRHRGLPAGAARVIDGRGSGVKTIRDAAAHIGVDTTGILAAHGMTGKQIWDLATVAVLPEYPEGRSRLAVTSLLYRTFLVAGARNGVKHVVTTLGDDAYRDLLLLGAPVEPLAGSAPYGTPRSHALYLSFGALAGGIAAQAGRLARPFGPIAGEIDSQGLRRLRSRRAAAGVSRRVSSGKGLDRQIVLVD